MSSTVLCGWGLSGFYQLGVNLGLLGQITGAGLCVIYTPNVYDTLSSVPSKVKLETEDSSMTTKLCPSEVQRETWLPGDGTSWA